MWQKVGWQSKTTFCHQAQYTVHWHTLWTQWACSNSKFCCGKGWYLLYLVMVVLNIAKAAVFAHSRCIQIKADVLNWMAKGRVFICNSNGNSQLCRKCIIMSISAFASNSVAKAWQWQCVKVGSVWLIYPLHMRQFALQPWLVAPHWWVPLEISCLCPAINKMKDFFL